tara:strand:- start:168 stop:362 length:195 start_codon:yes stop_codon:yes gene_type:complete
MLRTFLRQTSILLSIFIFKKIKLNYKKHEKIEKFIKKKANKFYIENPRLRIHRNLSSEILNIIK